jgi:crotonobetainyl-CoA:carnitine CoA-transferase CaiB-like acyl-CoA transferase
VTVEREPKPSEFFLSPYRVLDLTDPKGYMCGKILGGLGADVIKIEPPGGDQGRNIGPFYQDIPHPERSFFWYAFNVNKRGITLNLETEDGRDIFRRLVNTADFVIESFPPGYLEELGLGYSHLSRNNPRLIFTSITPFGQEGPRRDFVGSDLICFAGSGYMCLCGESGLPPLQITLPQAYLHGGAEAAMGTMVALRARQITGEGQQVDVSIQESITWECLNAFANWDMNRVVLKREGGYRVFGPYRIRYVYPCKDGHVIFLLLGGHIGSRGQRALAEWMDREAMGSEFLRNFDWESFDASSYSDRMARQLEPLFEKFFLTKTKEELFAGARTMQYLLAPMNTIKDLMNDPQLQSREFWVRIEHPEWGTVLTYPGAPFKSSSASWRMTRRAPLIGEHNLELYEGDLGITREQILVLKGSGVI